MRNSSAPPEDGRKSIDEVDRALEELRLEERSSGGSAATASADQPTSTLDNLLRINLQHLKRYTSSPPEYGDRVKLDDTRAIKPASEEYEVEGIVGHRYDKRRKALTYLVRWVGYSPLYDQWLTARDLRNAPEVLNSYRAKNGLL